MLHAAWTAGSRGQQCCFCCLVEQEEAQARFWAASQSEQKNFAASFLLVSGIDKPQESTHLHFRWAVLLKHCRHLASPGHELQAGHWQYKSLTLVHCVMGAGRPRGGRRGRCTRGASGRRWRRRWARRAATTLPCWRPTRRALCCRTSCAAAGAARCRPRAQPAPLLTSTSTPSGPKVVLPCQMILT